MSQNETKRDSVCLSCDEDLDLLASQSEVNQRRIKKLEQHKESTEFELRNLNSGGDSKILLETMKRIERNLRIEYDLRDGIRNAINAKPEI